MNNLEVAIEELKTERSRVSSRLDAIDLAIDNLMRVNSGLPERRVISNAADRRAVLLELLKNHSHGMKLKAIRDFTPSMSGKERSNALQSLKREKLVIRHKGLWLNNHVGRRK